MLHGVELGIEDSAHGSGYPPAIVAETYCCKGIRDQGLCRTCMMIFQECESLAASKPRQGLRKDQISIIQVVHRSQS